MLHINAQRLNEVKLLFLQGEWQRLCYKKVAVDGKDKISCPFSVGVAEDYVQSEKTVMIVGQEANSLTCDYDKWNLENMQKWAIAYLKKQLGIETDYTIDGKRLRYNHSPFWEFFRTFKNNGYFPCWNDLDRVKRYVGNNEYRLTLDEQGYAQRKILNEKFRNNKSLLQNEIDLLMPSVVVFAVGPKNPYFRTLGYAFDVDEKILNLHYPTPENPCREVSKILGLDMPAYWTYHPNYLCRKGLLRHVIEEIIPISKTE